MTALSRPDALSLLTGLSETADVRRARHAPGLLGPFNAAGVLDLADIHVSRCLTRLGGEEDPTVALAVALAVRAPRLGHVCVDLATVSETVVTDAEDRVADLDDRAVGIDVRALPWPPPQSWLERLAASPLVEGETPDPTGNRPLRLVGTRLYLHRYWQQEQSVAGDLLERARRSVAEVDLTVLRSGLDRLFGAPGEPLDLQRLAAAVSVLRRLSVIAGGPGTGKTTTVARIVTLLVDQARACQRPIPRVALAAPTGRAAARLGQAVREGAANLAIDEDTRRFLLGLGASTLHRLLGWRYGSRSRFRHDAENRLPHDLVIVDETSMVSLSLMAKLVDAVRADARLVLVGDPDQLVSVEAGAVLGDVVGPARRRMQMHADWRAQLGAVVGVTVPAQEPPLGTAIGDGVVVLRQVHRFGSAVATLAAAVQAGDGDATVAALRAGADVVEWLDPEPGRILTAQERLTLFDPVRRLVVETGRRIHAAAVAGDARNAAFGLGELRVLCAHRHGPAGVDGWTDRIERWLASAIEGYGYGHWYPGQPLLVTENDYELGLYNGDTGVVVASRGGASLAVFEREGTVVELSPARLRAVETMHAMTVHKGQGSQYQTVVLALPEPGSAVLTRQLLYTAITRARERLVVIGSEAAVRAGVARPVARASGLGPLLWGEAETGDPGAPGECGPDGGDK